jgi:glycosyltransferase involved in cell wall biosynthesis
MDKIDATLVIVGEGERRNALETNAQKFGVGERVRFLGHVSEKNFTLGMTPPTSSYFPPLSRVRHSESCN